MQICYYSYSEKNIKFAWRLLTLWYWYHFPERFLKVCHLRNVAASDRSDLLSKYSIL